LMKNPLGQTTTYPDTYDAGLLFPIPRAQSRAELGIADPLPFRGYDAWRAYELSWLDNRGKPVVAIGEFLFPVTSPHLVESKSLKLYLNSLNQERFDTLEAVEQLIAKDLGARSEEHTSELQSRENLVCRLLLDKKKKITAQEVQ